MFLLKTFMYGIIILKTGSNTEETFSPGIFSLELGAAKILPLFTWQFQNGLNLFSMRILCSEDRRI